MLWVTRDQVRVSSPVQGQGLVGLIPLFPQDYISLFPLDDTQPSKLMRLLSSNEEDSNILSSPSKCRRGWGDGSPASLSLLGVKCVFAQNPFPSQTGRVGVYSSQVGFFELYWSFCTWGRPNSLFF